MSENIYTFLIRLFPSHFREAYGDAALQLFRDRSRDEKGFFPRLRLWLDLLADLAISIPREYRYAQAVRQQVAPVPGFHFVADESPGRGALLCGAVLSLVGIEAFSLLSGHFTKHQQVPRNIAALIGQVETGGQDGEQATERQRVLRQVIANLKQYYVDPNAAVQIANALKTHQASGDYDALTGAALADLLTRQMREVSGDRHLIVEYSQTPLPAQPPQGPTPESIARYRAAMEQNNCMFEKIETLPHNIGYLKLNAFPEPSVCGPTADAAMASLNHADAIIFDLRDNTGGFPDMVALMAAYLFDHPEYLYNPREKPTELSWTRSPVPGNKLADKPVYVLTSARTLSGAEQFTYDLKMLKRATLVGETTGGAAHAGVWHRIDDHFGMGIPEVKAINPFSKTDWEGSGVEPDVKVNAADALNVARKLAERQAEREIIYKRGH